jgi:hypothetical protein
MPTEIPAQIEFEHLLSHTFPGFFLALTIFMVLDISSPYNLTLIIIKDINALIAFVGFILLIGTICGVIIDNIHHSFIEDTILKNFETVKKYDDAIRDCIKNSIVIKEKTEMDPNLTYQYFFYKFGPNAMSNEHYIRNAKYCYSEFFSNTFISLIPFSLIIPFYLLERFLISWSIGIFISLISFTLACFCLYSSYDTYLDYCQALFSLIRGYPRDNCPGPNDTSRIELTLK